MGYGKCGVLHIDGNSLCIQRLAFRAISASAKFLVNCKYQREAGCDIRWTQLSVAFFSSGYRLILPLNRENTTLYAVDCCIAVFFISYAAFTHILRWDGMGW